MIILFIILFRKYIPKFPIDYFRPFPFVELKNLLKIGLPSALVIEKTAVPMGVIAIIYESRPNVTSDAAALAIKSLAIFAARILRREAIRFVIARALRARGNLAA